MYIGDRITLAIAMIKTFFQPLKTVVNKSSDKEKHSESGVGGADTDSDIGVVAGSTEEHLRGLSSRLSQFFYDDGSSSLPADSHPDDAAFKAEKLDTVTYPIANMDVRATVARPDVNPARPSTIADTTTVDTRFVTPELIEKVVVTTENVRSYVGLKLVETTVFLLRNGLAYTGLSKPPNELELPASFEMADAENGWTTWHQGDSGEIYLQQPGDENRTLLSGEEINFSVLSNEDIAGLHTRVSAQTYGASQTTTWSHMVFNEDGSFELAESVLTTTGGADTLLNDTFTSSFQQHSASGSRVAVTNTAESIGSSDIVALANHSESEKPNEHLFGTYKLLQDGLSIELLFANGTVKRELFYRAENRVHFGSSSYRTQTAEQGGLDNFRMLVTDSAAYKRHNWLALMAESFAPASRQSVPVSLIATHSDAESRKN